jgi:hypothetical protein
MDGHGQGRGPQSGLGNAGAGYQPGGGARPGPPSGVGTALLALGCALAAGAGLAALFTVEASYRAGYGLAVQLAAMLLLAVLAVIFGAVGFRRARVAGRSGGWLPLGVVILGVVETALVMVLGLLLLFVWGLSGH